MPRRFIPHDGVLRAGFYWVQIESREEADVAYFNGHVWYLVADDAPRRDLIPISKPLVAPR